ncbi:MULTISPECIES: oxygenase MpaB family protein [Burkholderia]|uniref:Rubber oxygenase n=1 Tax=Burkholderia paludis TaxID=1506587 RepID=A0A6P2S4V3_9BURK|nr:MULTISPECIES: oxygenase MpaB family protein [Burkholderia]CAB3773350.1 hypothetical protein LMG30113_07088 [Burkholderia paludis]VWC45084.1 Rubber oxygenase [Burkholderia paludis]
MTNHPNPLLSSAPASVVNRLAIVERFGADKLALVLEMASIGDVLADAIVAEGQRYDDTHLRSLDDGFRFGLQCLASPSPAIHALLAKAEQMPDWIDTSSILRGSQAYLTIGPLWTMIALGPGSLAHTYYSPTISKVLTGTGNLDDRTLRRLTETAVWEQLTLRPGGVSRGAEGYVHTLQVRMLHARVRAGLIKRGWDAQALGSPINQLDMLRTWLDFTYVPFMALEKLGVTFDEQEFQDLYQVWQAVAHLLGIEERFYRHIVDQHSAAETLTLIDMACSEPDDGFRTLTLRMLEAIGRALQPALGIPEDASIQLMHAFCRLFHGDDFADEAGVERTWTSAFLPFIADANRYQRLLERSDPEIRQKKIVETLHAFDARIASVKGLTTYQSSIGHFPSTELPRTTDAM